MADMYMTKEQLAQSFKEDHLHVTEGVKICLRQAAIYTKRIKVAQSTEGADSTYKQSCEGRAKYMYLAIETAEEEKEQHWRYVEDSDWFETQMHDKYGDLDFVTDVDDLKKLLKIYRLLDMADEQREQHSIEHMKKVGVE